MIHTISIYFLLFITYSILGWCMEVIVKFIEFRRFINRGFLIGCYCPIYGAGAVLVTLMLGNFTDKPILLFFLSVTIASILEYTTSWIMEKVFHARWWDYSKDKFNINGRICLATMVPFGILSAMILYILNPIFLTVFERMESKTTAIIVILSVIIFAIDVVVSTIILLKFKNDNKHLEKDNTEEMSKKVRNIIASRSWGQRRLVRAFPNLKHVGTKIINNAKEIKEHTKEKIVDTTEKAKEKIADTTEKAKEKIADTTEKAKVKIVDTKVKAKVKIGEYGKKFEIIKDKHK